MENTLFLSLTRLAGQAPTLLVYLVGMILALVFWRRYPGPSALTFVATGLLFLTGLVQSFLFFYLLRARTELGWTDEMYGQILSANALIGSVLRAAAFAALLAAVFICRRGATRVRSNNALEPVEPASERSEDITTRPGG